jgi:diacylglycerol kinase family enzyme
MNDLLILNEAAGSITRDKDKLSPEALLEAFHAAGVFVELRLAPPRQLCEIINAAIARRPNTIYVGGGDGTISTAAGCLVDSNIALGVLPLGTLNHFAHDLGIPPTWPEAIAALARGNRRAVDVGEVNGRIFINNCSIGSYADAVRKRDALRRERGAEKWRAMLQATFEVFRKLRRLRLHIESAEKKVTLRTPFAVVANNCYSGHVLGSSLRPRLDEGRLWIYTTRAHRHADVLHLMWQSLLRSIDRVEGLDSFATLEASIASDRGSLPIAADGELLDLKPPFRFRSRPAALQVIAPSPPPRA